MTKHRGLPAPFYRRDGIELFCADNRRILSHLADASIDFIFTDPPYGNNNNQGDLNSKINEILGKTQKVGRVIANDGLEQADELVEFLFREAARLLPKGACICCCCAGGGRTNPTFARWSLCADRHLRFKHMVVWDKGPMGLGWHYRRSHELVLVAERPGAKCRWFDTSYRIEDIVRPGADGIRHIRGRARRGMHPTPKPPELAAKFIRLHTRPHELVLDPFAGGGSTLVAALRSRRRAIGVELDEEFCRMTVASLEEEFARLGGQG